MNRLLHKFDLTSWYERYSRLATYEGKKQFARTVYILSACIVAIIFIWYSGISNLSSHESVQTVLVSQQEELPTPSPNSIQIEINNEPSVTSEVYQSVTVETGTLDPLDTGKEAELSVPEQESMEDEQQNVPQVQDKKNFGEVNPTIYKGAKLEQVSLTFDDGYDKRIVELVLDVLKSKNIKCTFFVIGEAITRNPDVWKRAVNEGHQICNHTQNHKNLTKLSDDLVQKEITGWETTVRKYLGEDYLTKMKNEFPLIRFPGGNGGKDKRILSIAKKNGYSVIAWNLETYSSIIRPLKDTHTISDISKRIENHVVSKCSKGSIILLHFNEYDAGNLEGMIEGIINRGFEIKPVSEIIK